MRPIEIIFWVVGRYFDANSIGQRLLGNTCRYLKKNSAGVALRSNTRKRILMGRTVKCYKLFLTHSLVAKPRKNMKPVKHIPEVEYYKKHRGLIETTNGLLKEKANIQHTRHRCLVNFEVNIWSALIAYTYNDKMPSIKTYKKTIKPLFPRQALGQVKIAA